MPVAQDQRHSREPATAIYLFPVEGSVLQLPHGWFHRYTHVGNVEDEVLALVYHTKDDATEAIKSCARYFSVQVPEKADADGLVRCFGSTLCELGDENVCVLDQASDLGAYGSRSILVRGNRRGRC